MPSAARFAPFSRRRRAAQMESFEKSIAIPRAELVRCSCGVGMREQDVDGHLRRNGAGHRIAK